MSSLTQFRKCTLCWTTTCREESPTRTKWTRGPCLKEIGMHWSPKPKSRPRNCSTSKRTTWNSSRNPSRISEKTFRTSEKSTNSTAQWSKTLPPRKRLKGSEGLRTSTPSNSSSSKSTGREKICSDFKTKNTLNWKRLRRNWKILKNSIPCTRMSLRASTLGRSKPGRKWLSTDCVRWRKTFRNTEINVWNYQKTWRNGRPTKSWNKKSTIWKTFCRSSSTWKSPL